MISLGSNLVFSDAGPRKLAKRGCTTLVAFLLLNITRDALPDIAIALAGHADAFDVLGYDMLASDILGFAGFTFLFFAIIKYFQISPLATLLISLCMLTVNDLIPQLHLSSQFVSATLGNFFYADDYSCFPLLSWMIFPAIGYALASALRDIPDKDLFWKHVIAVCAIVLVAISVNMRKYGLNPLLIAASPVNDYITDFANVVLDAAIAWIWYGIFHFVYKRIRSARIKHIILCVSQAIMLFLYGSMDIGRLDPQRSCHAGFGRAECAYHGHFHYTNRCGNCRRFANRLVCAEATRFTCFQILSQHVRLSLR